MKNRTLYPLNALRAFEAAARHLSFAKAADELSVTPAAVSHQVRKLEDYLGLQLFRRLPRGLLLNDEGQTFAADLADVFVSLDKVIERTMSGPAQTGLTISVAPMFAIKWLVPRLQHFADNHPDVDVRMSSSTEVVDFQRSGFDAAIRLGRGQYPGLVAERLFDETLTPMCSPRLLDGLDTPDDLRDRVLLHDDSMAFHPDAPTWETWLDAAGAEQVDPSRGPRFSQPEHTLQAAIDGVGVVLGWRNLASGDLAAGRLVEPFKLGLPLDFAFYLVYPEAYADRRKIRKFSSWLLSQSAADKQLQGQAQG